MEDEKLHHTILRRAVDRLDVRIRRLMAARRRLQVLLGEYSDAPASTQREEKVPSETN